MGRRRQRRRVCDVKSRCLWTRRRERRHARARLQISEVRDGRDERMRCRRAWRDDEGLYVVARMDIHIGVLLVIGRRRRRAHGDWIGLRTRRCPGVVWYDGRGWIVCAAVVHRRVEVVEGGEVGRGLWDMEVRVVLALVGVLVVGVWVIEHGGGWKGTGCISAADL